MNIDNLNLIIKFVEYVKSSYLINSKKDILKYLYKLKDHIEMIISNLENEKIKTKK